MATRTISAAGGNYNTTGAWDEGVVPTSADDVVCRSDGTSGNLTVTAAAAAKSINLQNGSGYSGTLTINSSQTLTISGSLTLKSTMTLTNNGTITINAAGTLTSDTVTIGGTFNWPTAVLTLADAPTFSGTLVVNAGDNGAVAGSFVITVTGSLSLIRKFFISSGTPSILLSGTGTLTGNPYSSRSCSVPLTINTAGTITFATDGPNLSSSVTWTYIAGTVVTTGSTVYLSGNATLSGSWPTFNNLTVLGTTTLTINAAITISGAVTLTGNLTMSGAYAVTCGTLTISAGSRTLTRVNSWTITTIDVSDYTLTIAGAYDQTITNLYLYSKGTNSSKLTLPNGQRLTITGACYIQGHETKTPGSVRLYATSGTMYLTFSGTYSDWLVTSASIQNVNNDVGDTLWCFNCDLATGITNIKNITAAEIAAAMWGYSKRELTA